MATLTNLDQFNKNEAIVEYSVWLKELKADLNKELTVEEHKQAKASFYSMVYCSLTQNEV